LARLKQWKKDMGFGTKNVRNLCRVGAIKSVVDIVEVQEVKWEGISNIRQLYVFIRKKMLIAN
jgi:hypothetical protein